MTYMRKLLLVLSGVLLGLQLSPLSTASARPILAPPVNDNFLSATVLSGASGTSKGSNVGATKESGETLHAGCPGGVSIWYSWVAPATGDTEFNTAGSSFDTLLAVYTQRDGTAIASNDDATGYSGNVSLVTFLARKGTRYYIAVDGYGGCTGPVVLNWKPGPAAAPRNDNLSNGSVIQDGAGSSSDSNVGATKESWEVRHANRPGGTSIWYSWLAPDTGDIEFNTVGSSFDTLLAVYTRPNANGSLKQVAANDDAAGCSDHVSAVTFAAGKGIRYYIAVDGYGGLTGQVVLNWQYRTIDGGGESSRPADVAEQYSYTGSPLTVRCSSGYLSAGLESSASASYKKPAELDLCFQGFDKTLKAGIGLQLVGPDGQTHQLPSSQPRSEFLYVVPVDYPAGTYYITAKQLKVPKNTAKFTFRIVEATEPGLAVDPDIRIGADFNVYLAGFPPNVRIPLFLYHGSGYLLKPPVSYHYYRSYLVWTNDYGQGTYPLPFKDDSGANWYYLVAKPPKGWKQPSVTFSVSK